jgi:hypothetical protein
MQLRGVLLSVDTGSWLVMSMPLLRASMVAATAAAWEPLLPCMWMAAMVGLSLWASPTTSGSCFLGIIGSLEGRDRDNVYIRTIQVSCVQLEITLRQLATKVLGAPSHAD